MKDISKEKICAIIGTTVFHTLLLLLLYLMVMERVEPQPEQSNIEMQSAMEDVAGEKFIDAEVMPEDEIQVEPLAPSQEQNIPEELLIAQNDEPSIPVDTMEQHKQDEEKKRQEEAERQRQEAERKAKEKIARSVKGSFGKSGKISSTGGEENGVGESGYIGGTDNGSSEGSGNGQGVEYKVGNRTVIGELNRDIPVQEEGVVVVHVIVDSEGIVIEANAKTTSVALKRVAEKEAYKVRFNKVSDKLENENGTITFRFKMNY